MKQIIRTVLVAAAVLSAAPCFAATERDALYYILDGSGSMWGRVDGKMKIQIAKGVLGDLLREMPASVDSGLTVYGHRRKGDCSDIEEVIPIGAIDRDAAIAKVTEISPRGKTPMADSITQTLERLKSRETQTSVVLVSDGIETCDKDPCEITKQLRESGVKFVMHVVGFDVQGPTQEQLECIARAGGGQYFTANSAKDLLAALTAVKENVVEKKELPKVEPVEPIAAVEPEPEKPEAIEQKVSSASKSIRIKAAGPGRVQFFYEPWVSKPYYWKLLDPETGEEKGRFSGLDTQPIAAGLYQLAWRQVQHGSEELVLGEVFEIKSRETTRVPLKTGVKLNLPTWAQSKRPYYWRLIDRDTGERVASFSRLEEQLVPAGTYNLIWREMQHGANEVNLGPITIEPDKLNVIDIATAVNLVPAEWVPENPYYWRFRDQSDPKRIWGFSKDYRPQLLPPGTYDILNRPIQHGTGETVIGQIQVAEGRMTEFPINTGVKFIPPEDMKAPYRIKFISLDDSGKEGESFHMGRGYFPSPVPLAPGKYKITLWQDQHGSRPVTIVDSVEIPEGALVEIEL